MEGKFGPGLPSISELQKRTAIALVSTHPIFDYSQPLLENVIPVGGLHIRDAKPLPKVRNNNTYFAQFFCAGWRVSKSILF